MAKVELRVIRPRCACLRFARGTRRPRGVRPRSNTWSDARVSVFRCVPSLTVMDDAAPEASTVFDATSLRGARLLCRAGACRVARQLRLRGVSRPSQESRAWSPPIPREPAAPAAALRSGTARDQPAGRARSASSCTPQEGVEGRAASAPLRSERRYRRCAMPADAPATLSRPRRAPHRLSAGRAGFQPRPRRTRASRPPRSGGA